MKYLRLYEDIDWEFDYEDEEPREIIGNEYFTKFLVDRSVYDLYIKSVKDCNHERRVINTIADINEYIKIKVGDDNLRFVIDSTIYYACAMNRYDINWSSYNLEWSGAHERYSIFYSVTE